MRIRTLTGIVLALAALWGLAMTRSSAEPAAAPGATQGTPDETVTSAVPAPVRAPRATTPATSHPATLASETAASTAPAEPPPASEEQHSEARLSHARSVFAAEPVDRAWADEARYELESALSSLATKDVAFAPVECRSSLCSVSFSSDVEAKAREALETLVRSNAWTGPGMAVPMRDGEGKTTVHVFLARPGSDIPELDPA